MCLAFISRKIWLESTQSTPHSHLMTTAYVQHTYFLFHCCGSRTGDGGYEIAQLIRFLCYIVNSGVSVKTVAHDLSRPNL